MIQATGEFSVEAWVAPALVAADKSYMVSYSGGDTTRNFTLGQTNQDYDFMLRSSELRRSTACRSCRLRTRPWLLQASLQHVVLTYDPVNGRQIYVNGANTGVPDPQKGGTISNWDSTFALVLGNEVSGDRSWQGLIKFVAIHNRAMTAAQVLQNFNAGVGRALLRAVQRVDRDGRVAGLRHVDGQPVRQLRATCSTSRRSSRWIRPSRRTASPVQGMRIGINGTIPARRPGLHPAEYHDHAGELHVAGRSAVEHRHGHRLAERTR